MKVSLWAEIRRLHEVERLSQAAIARRLHCSHRTVRKALAHGVAARVEARRRGKASSTVTGRRSTRCWPSIPASRRCG